MVLYPIKESVVIIINPTELFAPGIGTLFAVILLQVACDWETTLSSRS